MLLPPGYILYMQYYNPFIYERSKSRRGKIAQKCRLSAPRRKSGASKRQAPVWMSDCPQVLLSVCTPVCRKERNVCKGNLSRVSLAR